MRTPAPNAIMVETIRGGTFHSQAMPEPSTSAPPATVPHISACIQTGM